MASDDKAQSGSKSTPSLFDFRLPELPKLPSAVEDLELLFGMRSRSDESQGGPPQQRPKPAVAPSTTIDYTADVDFGVDSDGVDDLDSNGDADDADATSVKIACTDTEFLIIPVEAKWYDYHSLDNHFLYRTFGEEVDTTVPQRYLKGISDQTDTFSVSREWIQAVCEHMSSATKTVKALRGKNFCAVIGYGIVFTDSNSFAVAHGNVLNPTLETNVDLARHDFFVRYTKLRERGKTYPVTPLVMPRASVLKDAIALVQTSDTPLYYNFSIQSEYGDTRIRPGSDNPVGGFRSDENNRVVVEVLSKMDSEDMREVTVGMLDPVTCSKLVEVEFTPNPTPKLWLSSFFYNVPRWCRIGIKEAWKTEPKFDRNQPPSFAARRGMLFVFAVQSAFDMRISLEDGWRGQRIVLAPEDVVSNTYTDGTARVMYSEKLQETVNDKFLIDWIKAHGGEGNKLELEQIRTLGYYGLFMDGRREDRYVRDAQVYMNTAFAL